MLPTTQIPSTPSPFFRPREREERCRAGPNVQLLKQAARQTPRLMPECGAQAQCHKRCDGVAQRPCSTPFVIRETPQPCVLTPWRPVYGVDEDGPLSLLVESCCPHYSR